MELWLHKTNQASSAGNFKDIQQKSLFRFRFIGFDLDFLTTKLPFPLGGR